MLAKACVTMQSLRFQKALVEFKEMHEMKVSQLSLHNAQLKEALSQSLALTRILTTKWTQRRQQT